MEQRVEIVEPTGRRRGIVEGLLLLAVAMLAAMPALLQPRLLFDGSVTMASAWPGLRFLVAAPDSGVKLVLWRAALVIALALGGWLTGRCAVALGAKGRGALASGSLFVAASAASSALWDPGGLLLLVAMLAAIAFVERGLVASRPPVASLLLLLLATWASAGALLFPLIAAWVLLAPESGSRSRIVVGLGVLIVPVALELLLRWPIGVATGAWTGLNDTTILPDAIAAMRDAMRGLIEGGIGVVSSQPFVSNWRPALGSAIWSPLFVLAGLSVLVSAVHRRAARAMLVGGLVIAVPIVLTAIGRPLRLIPLAVALPGIALVSAALAALQPKVGGAAAILLVGLQVAGAASARDLRSKLVGVTHPSAAARLAELDGDPAPLEESVFAAAAAQRRPLAAAVERELGWRLLQDRERAGDEARALDWVERWLARRPVTAPPLPELEARRIELLLPCRGPEAVAEALAEAAATRGSDRAYVSAVAAVMVEALHRSARDPAFVKAVVPLVEQLLGAAAARPDDASSAELQCLALLRVGQERLVEAVTLAEKAVQRAPDQARPHLVLARIYLGRDEWDAGLREVARARQLDREDPAAILLEGRLFCSNADLAERGIDRMLEAREKNPGLPGVREEIEGGTVAAASHLVAQGRVDAARDALNRAIAAVGRRPPMVRALAGVARQQRAFEAAVVLLEEVVESGMTDEALFRELAEARRDAGYGRLLQHDRPAAIVHFERAIAIAPADFDRAGMQAVVAQFRSEERAAEDPVVAEARTAFEEALRLHAAGDVDGAVAGLRRSIELLPLNPLAHMNLGRIELERGHPKEAEGALRTALAIAAAKKIELEEAWPLLFKALAAQATEQKKIDRAVDEYLRLYPQGRFRDQFQSLHSK